MNAQRGQRIYLKVDPKVRGTITRTQPDGTIKVTYDGGRDPQTGRRRSGGKYTYLPYQRSAIGLFTA